ncbi:hypothetical protein ElyMa_000596500 [Elysia marginata]|uniref:Uncharacterized protein n=1 Tax=Elysia marginata TaxID=1093978 RepID=A0AAV4G7X9_9GAST|nr:hypothetical protein ElyMa_000596500 [Elysia marginata]
MGQTKSILDGSIRGLIRHIYCLATSPGTQDLSTDGRKGCMLLLVLDFPGLSGNKAQVISSRFRHRGGRTLSLRCKSLALLLRWANGISSRWTRDITIKYPRTMGHNY